MAATSAAVCPQADASTPRGGIGFFLFPECPFEQYKQGHSCSVKDEDIKRKLRQRPIFL